MKPSYEELEDQLNRSRRLCDAALANERVWETTMMQACGEDGPKSVADKFAELEQKLIESERYSRQADITIDNLEMKLAQMAAENAKLADCANFYRLGFKPAKGAFGIEYRPTEQLLDDCGNTALEAIKTTATDSFLDEVRAGAVDEVCLKISNYIPNCYQDELVGLDMAATICGDFAAEIRKGVQS